MACRHSRAYIRHLFMAHEMLGPISLTAHNLTYYQRLLAAGATQLRRTVLMSFTKVSGGFGSGSRTRTTILGTRLAGTQHSLLHQLENQIDQQPRCTPPDLAFDF